MMKLKNARFCSPFLVTRGLNGVGNRACGELAAGAENLRGEKIFRDRFCIVEFPWQSETQTVSINLYSP